MVLQIPLLIERSQQDLCLCWKSWFRWGYFYTSRRVTCRIKKKKKKRIQIQKKNEFQESFSKGQKKPPFLVLASSRELAKVNSMSTYLFNGPSLVPLKYPLYKVLERSLVPCFAFQLVGPTSTKGSASLTSQQTHKDPQRLQTEFLTFRPITYR